MKDLFTYDNGKPIVSPWRRETAKVITDVEIAIRWYCTTSDHLGARYAVLYTTLLVLRNHMKSRPHRKTEWLLSRPDPWSAEVNERIQAIEAKVALLKASGQL